MHKKNFQYYIQEQITEFNNKGLYSLFESKFSKDIFSKKVPYQSKKYFFDLFKDWDRHVAIPKELGIWLEDLISNPNLTIGVHRTPVSEIASDDEKLKSIMNDGLINTGHLFSSGVYEETPALGLTVSFPSNLLDLIILIKSTYKSSTGAVLLAFPRNLVDKDGEVSKENISEIYTNHNQLNYIDSKYIVGYIDNSYGVMNFFDRSSFKNSKMQHDVGHSK